MLRAGFRWDDSSPTHASPSWMHWDGCAARAASLILGRTCPAREGWAEPRRAGLSLCRSCYECGRSQPQAALLLLCLCVSGKVGWGRPLTFGNAAPDVVHFHGNSQKLNSKGHKIGITAIIAEIYEINF